MHPAKPSNIFTKSVAAISAVVREVSYVQLTPIRRGFWGKVPPFGIIILLLAYLGFVLALEFINNDTPGAQHQQALDVRAAWLAVAQVPLLILLAGKNNLIGLVTGVSYERLNVIHRWVSRVLLLLATLHLGYQNYGWSLYGLVHMEWSTDSCPPTGIAAYTILLWLNLSTLAPFRNFSYEFFVVQHVITFFGFIIAVMIHLPSTALYSRVYIYIPIALYIVDRLLRTLRFAYNNIYPGRATLTTFEGGVTKIRVPVTHVRKWRPGAHVFLKVPRLGLIQSHPATIASVPSSHDNDLVFVLKGHKGFTNRHLQFANSSTTALLPMTQQDTIAPQQTYTALIDGPYGGTHADFAAFDTVLLIAGSTGVTFILPQPTDDASTAEESKHASTIFDDKSPAIPTITTAIEPPKPPCCTNNNNNNNNKKKQPTTTTTTTTISSIATLISGRPPIPDLLWTALDRAQGETGVAVCGPLGLNATVRTAVAKIGDARAVSKGSGAQGVYLHAEGFCW